VLSFLGRKATVLIALVAVLVAAAFLLPVAQFSTLATAIPALYVAFVGGHAWQQIKAPPVVVAAPVAPKADPKADEEEGS